MKNEKSKRFFLIMLFVLLVVLYFFSVKEGDNITDNSASSVEKKEISLTNDTLFLRIIDEESIFIGGEGVLEASDFRELLKYHKILGTDIERLVIGDEITELGYNCINNYVYLESIKIGLGTVKIRNGGLKNCSSLKYVYLPNSLEKVGKDFLYGCNNLEMIVTNGKSDKLASLFDLGDYKIVEKVESLDELPSAMEGTPYRSYDSTKLASTDPEAGADPIALHFDYVQFGPYAFIKKGDYKVVISGENLDKIVNDNIYINVKGVVNSFDRSAASITNTTITYTISVAEDTDSVEFCIYNGSENEIIQIQYLDIYDLNIEVPDSLQCWW